MSGSRLTPLPQAIAAFAAGRQVIIVDDEDRENEGDLVVAADFADATQINFMTVHGRGLVCLAMQAALLDRLQIPMMVPALYNRSGFGTGFTVSVEAAEGVSTGISASDRAQTIRTLIAPDSTPDDIATPGHMFPLRARDGGVLERRGQTEASVDLAKLAGLTPAAVICEVMREDGEMMRLDELLQFADVHDLAVISVEQIAAWRRAAGHVVPAGPDVAAATFAGIVTRPDVIEIARSTLPTRHAVFDLAVFRDAQGLEHSVLSLGEHGDEPADGSDDGSPTLVRLHSECLTGDAFGSLRCDCGEQLQRALARIADAGHGVLVYLRQEGRGIGLGNKIRAYALQDAGVDTLDANEALGFPADARSYDVAAAILRRVGATRIALLDDDAAKRGALEALGIEVVERLAHGIEAREHDRAHPDTRTRRAGHRSDADVDA